MIMANTSTLSTAGLIARGDDDAPVPLTGVSIEAEITILRARRGRPSLRQSRGGPD